MTPRRGAIRLKLSVESNSGAEGDHAEAYRENAAAYVTKPVGFDGILALATSIRDFGMTSGTVPSA